MVGAINRNTMRRPHDFCVRVLRAGKGLRFRFATGFGLPAIWLGSALLVFNTCKVQSVNCTGNCFLPVCDVVSGFAEFKQH